MKAVILTKCKTEPDWADCHLHNSWLASHAISFLSRSSHKRSKQWNYMDYHTISISV